MRYCPNSLDTLVIKPKQTCKYTSPDNLIYNDTKQDYEDTSTVYVKSVSGRYVVIVVMFGWHCGQTLVVDVKNLK